ncbi:MAG: hypothetical protein ACRDZ8_21535 [Acidimicrobiales bacterium]
MQTASTVIQAGVDNAMANVGRAAGVLTGPAAPAAQQALAAIKARFTAAQLAVKAGASQTFSLSTMRQEPNWQQQVATVVARVQAETTVELDAAQTALDAAVATIGRLVLPQRPQPVTTVQEAQLAGLKGDLKMVLDAVAASDVPTVIGDELRSRTACGDDLAVWLLGGSDWPTLYARSRGIHPALIDQQIGAATAVTAGVPEARDFLRIAQGPQGLAGAIFSTRQIVGYQLADLAAGRYGSLDIAGIGA